jgi:hypothetical protein
MNSDAKQLSATTHLGEARAKLRAAADLLMRRTPDALESCERAMEEAVLFLESATSLIQAELERDALKQEVASLRSELHAVRTLLQNAVVFNDACSDLLESSEHGYANDGSAPGARAHSRIAWSA